MRKYQVMWRRWNSGNRLTLQQAQKHGHQNEDEESDDDKGDFENDTDESLVGLIPQFARDVTDVV